MTTFNLTGNNAIHQGASYQCTTFYYPEDISDWTPRGQVRKTYLSDVLVSFTFAPLTYQNVTLPDGNTGDRTLIIPTLTASETSQLPVTAPIISTNIVGYNSWVYDIELESDTGEVIKLASGYVQVLAEVTHD
jgi:hypothetical protein